MSQFKKLSEAELNEHLSNFLVNSWSYSKVSEFSRNEKAFEMHNIYGHRSKISASTVAGNAYHFALDRFFNAMKDGDFFDLPTLEKFAFEYIEERPAYIWKIQKTTPTVEECKIKATTTVTQLLKNFFGELTTYTDQINEVLDVEVYCDEFVTINGVEIPLPCHAKIDLVIKNSEGIVAVIDHKSKQVLSDESELRLSIGVQAMTYALVYEAKTGIKVDEVWFVENKYSKNRDGSAQMNAFKVELDKDTRALYEQILYEPLKRMISAVNDPDYVYMINDSDNYIDRAEMYDFWAKTMTAEVEEFNVDPSKKEMVSRRLKKIRDTSIATANPKIIKEFRRNASEFIQYDLSNKNMTEQEKIEHVLRTFGIITKVAHFFDGYSSNTYLLEVSAGVKIASIKTHRLDVANALNVSTVRIAEDLVVYENRSYVSVEMSKKRTKDLLFDPSQLVEMKIPIGRDNYDNLVYWNLNNHSTPHALICGSTGSGKSVCLNTIIEYAKLAGIKIVILDPKYEFVHLKKSYCFVYNDILEIENQMIELVEDMNDLVKRGGNKKTLVIFDEFADALAQSRSGNDLKIYETIQVGNFQNGNAKVKRECTGELKSLEENLRILLQKGRSVGFRIVAATQRASVKVITGDAKANFPVQICFRVPKEIDSRVVLDEAGAEALSGMGDGLINSPEYKGLVRFQAYYKPIETK